jgi:hypothetical protein
MKFDFLVGDGAAAAPYAFTVQCTEKDEKLSELADLEFECMRHKWHFKYREETTYNWLSFETHTLSM